MGDLIIGRCEKCGSPVVVKWRYGDAIRICDCLRWSTVVSTTWTKIESSTNAGLPPGIDRRM